MAKLRSASASAASELVLRLTAGPPCNHLERAELASKAVGLARQAGQPLLEADALLAQYRWRAPFAAPAQALSDLQRAESIFLAYEQSLSATRCRIEQACAVGDLGQEVSAIHMAEDALLNEGLRVEDRLHAHLNIAACHLHTGDIDASERQLWTMAQPLVLKDTHSALRARVKWQQGMVLMARLIARHEPGLWLTFVGLPEMRTSTRPLAEAMALMDEAQHFLVPGYPSGELRLARFGGLALLEPDDHAQRELETLWQDSFSIDPALAVRVQFTLGLVNHRKGLAPRALQSLDRAFAMAQAWDQLALARAISLHQSQIHEAMGQTSKALAALKVHGQLLARSLRLVPTTAAALQPRGIGPAQTRGEPAPAKVVPLLEPACLKRAERFIDTEIGNRMRVADVVTQCGVSRRTLENAFRTFRATSVTQFILSRQMAQAARLLRHTQRSVADIARDAGYQSPSAFAKEFKLRFGALPSQWRKHLPTRDSV